METPCQEIGYTDPSAAERGRAAPAGSSGAPPSNRASDSCTQAGFRVLSQHIDSLEISYQGILREGFSERLQDLKVVAQSESEVEQTGAQVTLAGHMFSVLGKGAKRFPFVLENGMFLLKLADRGGGSAMPFAYCQIRSGYLVQAGPFEAEEQLLACLHDLGIVKSLGCVARVDLAVDFVSEFDMDSWSRKAWVTKIRSKNNHAVGNQFTGWKIGTHRNPISFRMYDKTEEVKSVSGKVYLYDIWEKAGHVPWESVWRAEGEFRREALRERGLSTVSDVVGAQGGLWATLTQEVIRLCVPNEANETRGRWPKHPLWAHLSAVVWSESAPPLLRIKVPNRAPSDLYFFTRQRSLIEGYMAAKGIRDPGEAVVGLHQLTRRKLSREALVTGVSPEQALSRGAAVKARRYLMPWGGGAGGLAPPPQGAREVRDPRRGSRRG